MENNYSKLAPVVLKERFQSLDVLRGFAVLGILIMNIQSFSMISAAYINPMAYGDMIGINKLVWIVSHIVADSKFMAIFSMLFGAGIILFSDKAISKGIKARGVHYRRMLWLLIFGLAHAYLLWYGDILVAYAVCGMMAFGFRKRSNRTILIWSLIFLMVPTLLYTATGFSIETWPQESYEQNMDSWLPSQEHTDEEVTAMQGNWFEQMSTRVNMAVFLQTFLFLFYTGWRVMGLMLLGMLLFRKGILTLQKSQRYYIRMVFLGLIPGLALVVIGLFENFRHNWLLDYSMYFGMNFNYWGSIGVALAYIGVVMLICKSGVFNKFRDLLAATGRMAFTNYILQSLIAFFIFYGSGFGLFGRVERFYQVLIVLPIWVVVVAFSKFWLSRYRFGPLEWLWRQTELPPKRKK